MINVMKPRLFDRKEIEENQNVIFLKKISNDKIKKKAKKNINHINF